MNYEQFIAGVSLITPVMTFVVGGYIKDLKKKIDSIEAIAQDIKIHQFKINELSLIKDEWAKIKNDLTKLMVEIEYMKKSQEEIAVVKRDMGTIWKNIDKIKDAFVDDDQMKT